ncbi:MAG: hypothetical protein M3151_14610 [Actinomycetota bacterium]|nr:hypothetical protein [Actinomycetota bacterium]
MNPEQMREVFQGHLRSLDREAVRVAECQIFQTRFQRDRGRYVMQYVVRLSGPEEGRERDQYFTGIMHAGGTAPSREGMGADEPTAPSAPHYIPELDMHVEVFPRDRWLPNLPLLVEGPPFGVEAPLLESFGPGDWRVEAWRADPVRYLFEMRATLRLTVRASDAATGAEREKRFYAKVYADEEGERTHKVLRALWENAATGDEHFTVGRPVVYLPDLGTSIQEEVNGPTVKHVLIQENGDVTLVRRVARALAAMHLGEPVTSRRRRPQREASIMRKAGEVLPLACPHLRAEIEEIVAAVVADLREVPPAPTHCDLLAVHVLVEGDRLALIDLDEFAAADPILDVARFLGPLATAPLRISFPREHALPAAHAFVEEYFAHVPPEWRERLPLHYTIAILKMAVGYSRRQEPGYADKVEFLVREARGYLTNETWR